MSNQLQSLIRISTSYSYDQNGNMTYDGLRGFSINYNNPLNLPQTISKASESILYIYSANGEKLAKRMKDNSWQYYADGFVCNNDKSLNYFSFEEGRVKNVSGGFSYEYHLKDHLGNTRVAFEPNGSSTNTLQVAEYYPFGSSFVPTSPNNDNKYLYNGKEKQDDVLSGTNLDWYDYGARFYDPQIGRFTTIDPLAEKSRRWSPYGYCEDNSIRFIDPDGMAISTFDGDLARLYTRKLQEVLSNNGDFLETNDPDKKRKSHWSLDIPGQNSEKQKNSHFILRSVGNKQIKTEDNKKNEQIRDMGNKDKNSDLVATGVGIEFSTYLYGINIGWYKTENAGALNITFESGPNKNFGPSIYGATIKGDKNKFNLSNLKGNGAEWSLLEYTRASDNFTKPNYIINQVSMGTGNLFKITGGVMNTRTVILPTTPMLMLDPLP